MSSLYAETTSHLSLLSHPIAQTSELHKADTQ